MRPEIIQFNKDPEADLDFALDWSEWLSNLPINGPADTIASSSWVIPGGTLTNHDSSNTDTEAITWFAGGELGKTYTVVNRISTTQGRTEDQTVSVYIQEH